ncbi:MAG: glycosyltransferase family 1 protein [Chloroflexi bacterium]|nr:glycosyltransferase family 1 protein [Chloroflexota bacterium]
MADNRLLQALQDFNPDKLDQLFGGEQVKISRNASSLAPVKRVALFTEAFLPKVDGVTKSAYLTLRYLQQTGREVLVFAPDISPSHVGSTRVIALRSLGVPIAPETRMALPTGAVEPILTEFQPDLIHMFSPALMSVTGMWVGRKLRIPIVANYQTDLPGYTSKYGVSLLEPVIRTWLRYIHNRCHLTLAPSNYTLQELRHNGYRRLRIWGRGVDNERFNPKHHSDEMRQRLLNGRDPHSLLCVYVGRLAREKRVDLLLEVAKLPGVALTIIGDGAQREELEKMFAGTDTYFMGYLFGEDLGPAYASADVFLFPGQRETFGQVVQEAMASGLPAVIINEGGITDLVTDGVNGFVCPDDPSAFAQAVKLLRDNSALRVTMANESRRITEKRPWEAIMAQLEEYYAQAVALNARFNRLYYPETEPIRFLPTLLRLDR